MLKNIYAIGGSMLFNAQSAISAHGQNVANASTPGYRRRTVEMKSSPYLQFGDHMFGTGSDIQRLQRHFDDYLAVQQHQKNGENSMWNAARGNLSAMDSLFKNSATTGLTKAMTDFWNQWQVLSEHPGQDAARTGLMGKSEGLLNLIKSKRADMDNQMELMDKAVAQEVDTANRLMNQLAEINRQIVANKGDGVLEDGRDKIIEDLSKIVSLKAIIKENGQATVSLTTGQTLVDGVAAYELKFEGPKTIRDTMDGSAFKDTIHYEGTSNREFTIECVSGGSANGGAGAAKYRVSLDGGTTWMKNSDGTEKQYTAEGPGNKIKIGEVSVWFGTTTDSTQPPTTDMTKGDRLVIKPKKNLFWYKNSSTSEDITPHAGNEKALTGGSLAGLLAVRDQNISQYARKLDAFAKSLVWEVNFAHSQGAGSKHLSTTIGTYKAEKINVPLDQSGLSFASKLKKGNFSLAIYNGTSGAKEAIKPVDFSSIAPPGTAEFDPAVHTLENVRDAINATFTGQASASIENGKLRITAAAGKKMSFAGDSSGLLAGLGLNTFFDGDSASSMAINSEVKADISRICAGHVNGAGEVNSGDNTVARKLADMATKQVDISTDIESSTGTFQEYLSNLIALVGADTARAESASAATGAQVKFLNARQEEVSGVNMKEEMIKIKQYEQSYRTASQLIKIANDMYDTLLSMR